MNKDIVFKDNYKLVNYLKENLETIKYLRICWVDIANKIRCKSINTETFFNGENDSKLIYLTVSDICMSLLGFVDEVALPLEDLKKKEYGVVYLVPDFTTITILPYCKSHAQVIGSFYKLNKTTRDLEPWNQCPRHCLTNSINKLSSMHSLSLKGSFEEEFYLIKKDSIKNENVDFNEIFDQQSKIDGNTTCSFHSIDNYSKILNDISDCLHKQGVPIEQLLKEGGRGQFEFSIEYDDILKTCDRHIIFRQTVHSVALLNGFVATFLPKPFKNSIGTGCHAHLSLWDVNSGNNITPDQHGEFGISFITQKFIGGLLEHSSSLTALFNPTSNSYDRLVPSQYNGTTVGWGVDNKGAFCRIPSNFLSKGNSNFELKTIDHTSNPYLVMASIIHCGIYGINNLPKGVSITPKSSLVNDIKDINIPSNINDALDIFYSNQYLKESIGTEISNIFYTIKQKEENILLNLSKNEKKLKILQIY